MCTFLGVKLSTFHAVTVVESNEDESVEADVIRHTRKHDFTDAEMQRTELAKNSCSMPRGLWHGAGEASDARVIRTS